MNMPLVIDIDNLFYLMLANGQKLRDGDGVYFSKVEKILLPLLSGAEIFGIYLFGSPDVFRLRKEPINSLSCVRASVPVLQPRPFDIFF